VLIGPIAIALAGLLIALVLGTTVLMHSHNGIIVLVLVVVALLLYLGYRTWEWSEDYFVVTSDRMLQASGVFTRKIAMMPLVKVTDMSFKRSTLGRMLGFGQFILESAGQDQALRTIDHVPYSRAALPRDLRPDLPGREDPLPAVRRPGRAHPGERGRGRDHLPLSSVQGTEDGVSRHPRRGE
jgi:Bacterial membrane flanked domain.